ncbi:MAG: DEAD/DEAH box helicase family protein, partial [Bacteroidota bacterium]
LDVSSSLSTIGNVSHLSSRRNEDFANSARKFATALFSLFSSIDHTCEIIFVMGKPDLSADDHPEQRRKEGFDTRDAGSQSRPKRGAKKGSSKSKQPKGLDDLIEVYGAKTVTEDLLNFNFSPAFRESEFFAGFTLAQSTCNRKLIRRFLNTTYRTWFEALITKFPQLGAGKTFIYRGATYEPISTGNLYDETITYQLNTDPFAVNVPTDHLVIKHFITDQSKALCRLILDHDRLAIRAPTGSGKTTFLIKFAKRQKTRMVIAMPTINLAEQTARGTGGFVLTGERNTAKIRAANEKNLVICTYDTLHQVPDLWRRILVIDEAHNLINQYGQVYNGFNPFRAETLRNCVHLFPEAKKTILLSGTMPPLLCHAFNFHLVTFRRLENPTVRVFDIEANGSDNAALSKCLITRLAEVFPPRAERAENSGSLKAKRLNSKSGSAASKQSAEGRLHVVFWNHTDQINRLKDTLIELGYLTEDEIAIISRTHYDAGKSPDLDDIIRNQKINPRIKLLLCTCLISEGVNIKNTNVGRIYTVGLRCEDTFRQFIARFRKLKTVNVFSILEAERDLRPEFFQSAEMELLENLERAKLQAKHLRRRKDAYQCDYDETELPFLDQIEGTEEYYYRNQLFNLVYLDGDWHADPLHVLAAIHGRKLATSNNCYFYTRLRANNFSVLRVKDIKTDESVEETINAQHETAKATRKDFREKLLEDLTSYPEDPINALYLLYQEKDNRHGLQTLRTLVPDLLDDCDGTTGAQYLGQHRRHLDDYTKRRILRFAKLHALGVHDKTPFLSMSIADFNHEYQAALFHFEQLVADDSELRKRMLPAHKEEVRIKQKIVTTLALVLQPIKEGPEDSLQPIASLSGEALLQRLVPLLSVPRPHHLPLQPAPRYRKSKSNSPLERLVAFDILGLTPAKAINLLRRIMHTTVTGHGRYRTITIGAPFSKTNPPSLAALATKLIQNPVAVLPLLSS